MSRANLVDCKDIEYYSQIHEENKKNMFNY